MAGERWAKPEGKGTASAARQNPSYRDARVTTTLGPGLSRNVTIHCGFPPERVVVDPDIRVLQLHRKLAVATL